MTDYAAAAVQPIVQGLVTVPTGLSGGVLAFTGRGALPVPGRSITILGPPIPAGVIVLTLDVGLPGNAGAIEPAPDGAIPPTLVPAAPLARTLISLRSPTSGVVTTIDSVSVAYGNFSVPATMDGSLRQIAITLADGAVLTDPVPTPPGGPFTAGANGFEIIVWAGVESP